MDNLFATEICFAALLPSLRPTASSFLQKHSSLKTGTINHDFRRESYIKLYMTTKSDVSPLIAPLARVAVLGAGAAGLQAARQLTSHGYETHVYEATDHIGGTWAYSATVSPSSCLYASLRCNLPKQIMTFEGIPYDEAIPSFAPHDAVLQYLRDYTRRFQLSSLISFNCAVLSVRKEDSLWHIGTTQGVRTYHAVFVCTGHFSLPKYWKIDGLEYLRCNGIDLIHSHRYRQQDAYVGRSVLVVGAGPSGIDIALEISTVATHVYLSHGKQKRTVPMDCPTNLQEIGLVDCVLPDGRVKLLDGTVIRVDAVVTCTGYRHRYAFLQQGVAGIRVWHDEKSVRGLVRHCVALKDPTLCFIGLPEKTVPFIMFEQQVGFAIAVLNGAVTREQLQRLVDDDHLCGEQPDDNHFHVLGDRWDYMQKLARLAGRPDINACSIEIYKDVERFRRWDPKNYRNREYSMYGDGPGMWQVVPSGDTS